MSREFEFKKQDLRAVEAFTVKFFGESIRPKRGRFKLRKIRNECTDDYLFYATQALTPQDDQWFGRVIGRYRIEVLKWLREPFTFEDWLGVQIRIAWKWGRHFQSNVHANVRVMTMAYWNRDTGEWLTQEEFRVLAQSADPLPQKTEAPPPHELTEEDRERFDKFKEPEDDIQFEEPKPQLTQTVVRKKHKRGPKPEKVGS